VSYHTKGCEMKQLILISLIIFLLPLVACGKPSDEQEPPASQQVTVNCAETIAAHQYLLKQHEELKGLYQNLQAKQGEWEAAVRTLEDANLALGIELAILKGLEEGRAGDYEDLVNELARLKAEQKDWDNLSKIRYEGILKQYEELSALYPPKNFPDHETLVGWRAKSGNITEDRPLLVLQKLAMDEGYLVSVCPEQGFCVVIAGDYWYKLTSDDKYLVEKIGKVE